jgi:V8-like Glu-specific endopeptidase
MKSVHIVRLADRPDPNGNYVAFLANGRTAIVPASLKSAALKRSAQESGKLSPAGIIPADCGSSQVYVNEKDNDHPVRMTTGFTVFPPAVYYSWEVNITGPDYSYHYTAGGILADDSSWNGSHDSDDDYTAGAYTADVTTASYATLSDGEVCTSLGPDDEATLTSPDTPVEMPFTYPSTSSSVGAEEMKEARTRAEADAINMTPVADKSQAPYSSVARLDVTWANYDFSSCTGATYGANLLVTAGHCLYDPDEGGWPNTVFVIPQAGPNADFPYSICKITKMYTSEGWEDLGLREYDYGAVKYSCPGASSMPPSLNMQAPASQNDSVPGPFSIIGYPKIKDNETPKVMYTASASESSHTQRTFTYPVATAVGVSGGPVVVPCDAGYCIVGVHILGDGTGTGGTATRITQANLPDFQQWSNEPL